MKFYLITETHGIANVVRVIEDDRTGKATLPRARSIALAHSGLNHNVEVQIATVRETVRAT